MAGAFFLLLAALQGLAVVGVLAIADALVAAISPGSGLPFSIWWGLFCIPGAALAVWHRRNCE